MSISSDEFSTLLGNESLSPEAWGQVYWSTLRLLARTDPLAYGEFVFRLRPAPHHAEMIGFIEEQLSHRANAVILEPRGHAKTTWANSIYLSILPSHNRKIRIAPTRTTPTTPNTFSTPPS